MEKSFSKLRCTSIALHGRTDGVGGQTDNHFTLLKPASTYGTGRDGAGRAGPSQSDRAVSIPQLTWYSIGMFYHVHAIVLVLFACTVLQFVESFQLLSLKASSYVHISPSLSSSRWVHSMSFRLVPQSVVGRITEKRWMGASMSGSGDTNDRDVVEVDEGKNDGDEVEPLPFKGFGKKDDLVKQTPPKQKTKEEMIEAQALESRIRASNMFRKKRAKEEETLDKKIAMVQEEEELLATDPSVGAVPEVHCLFI